MELEMPVMLLNVGMPSWKEQKRVTMEIWQVGMAVRQHVLSKRAATELITMEISSNAMTAMQSIMASFVCRLTSRDSGEANQ